MTSIAFAIDCWDPNRGGAERAFDAFARHLVRRGHDVVVCCHEVEDNPHPPSDDDPRIVGVMPPLIGRSLMPGRFERILGERLVAATEKEQCDLLVGLRHLPRADLLWPHGGAHLATLQARRRARGERLGDLRGRHRVFAELEGALLESTARKVVCVSELVRQEFIQLYPDCVDRLVLVPNGVDRTRFTLTERAQRGAALRSLLSLPRIGCDSSPEAGTPLLAFVAREPELKGLPILLDALRGLLGVDWQLIVAGPKHLDAWRTRASGLDLPADRLRFVSQVDTSDLFAAADLLVHPTWRDTSGLVLLEALSSGIPAITTDAAGEAALLGDGSLGSVVTTGDTRALRSSLEVWLERIASEPIDRQRIRDRTRDRDVTDWMVAMEGELLEL